SGRSRKPYLVADAISTPNGPFEPTPRKAAACSVVHAFPAFCSRIAFGMRSAFSMECRGYLARVPFVRCDAFVGLLFAIVFLVMRVIYANARIVPNHSAYRKRNCFGA